MNKNLRWKILVIVGVTALAVWSFTPPSKRLTLGLDLQGGIQLIMQVKTDDALRIESETSSEQLKAALKDKGIAVTTKADITNFTVMGVPAPNDQEFRTIADQQVSASFNREARPNGEYFFEMRPNLAVQRRAEAVQQAILTIDKRVNELGAVSYTHLTLPTS